MIKGDSHAIINVLQCGRRMYSIKSMECHIFGLVYAYSCLSVFIIISCYGQRFQYVEFPCYLRSVESGAQMYCVLSLFGRYS